MSKIKLAVFDMAGTTVNEKNVVYKTIQKSLEEYGYKFSLEEVLENGAGKEKLQAIKDLLASKDFSNHDSKNIFQSFRENLNQAYSKLAVKPFPGTEELIKKLRSRGIKIALNTGYSFKVAGTLLKKMDWKEGVEFDTLVTADDVENGRPAPDMIELAMKKCGVSNSTQVLKAGDSAIDIEEGKNCNCGITVGLTTGAQSKAQLLSANPTFVFDHLSEILPHL